MGECVRSLRRKAPVGAHVSNKGKDTKPTALRPQIPTPLPGRTRRWAGTACGLAGQMASILLEALDFPNQGTSLHEIAAEVQSFRALVVWLEDTKVCLFCSQEATGTCLCTV